MTSFLNSCSTVAYILVVYVWENKRIPSFTLKSGLRLFWIVAYKQMLQLTWHSTSGFFSPHFNPLYLLISCCLELTVWLQNIQQPLTWQCLTFKNRASYI